jgi:hypothetical protein
MHTTFWLEDFMERESWGEITFLTLSVLFDY